EFEKWMDGILHAAMKFEGHMGVNVIRPVPPGRDYTIIFRFDNYSNLRRWEESEVRNDWIKKSLQVAEGEPVTERRSGLEFWFTPKAGATAPPRHKMLIVTVAIVFILLSTLISGLRQLLDWLPSLLTTFIAVVIMV